MKSRAEVAVKGKLHEVSGKTKEELGKLMNDPTLEGKDENKVEESRGKPAKRTAASKSNRAAAPVARE